MSGSVYWNEKPAEFNGSLRASVLAVRLDDKFLLARKAVGEKFSESWGLFGGKLEPNEDPLDAAVREFHEEAGVLYDKAYMKHLADLYYILPELHYTLHVYHITVSEKPDIILSREHDAYEWMTVEQIKGLQLLMPGVIRIVESFI